MWKGLCLFTWVIALLLVAGWQWQEWRTEQSQSVGEIVKAVNALHGRLERLEKPTPTTGMPPAAGGGSTP